MPTYSDYGIVLHSYDLGEADKILNIYTRENGLVRAIGKGAKKANSKFGRKTDQLSSCYFHLAKGKNLDIISECEQITSFPKLRGDLLRLTNGILFLEVVWGFAHEQESESIHVYDLLYESLEKLQTTCTPGLCAVKFITNFLSIHGLKPQLTTCVSCSAMVSESINSEEDLSYLYSGILGGILCNECSRATDYKPVTNSVLQLLEEDVLLQRKPSENDIRLALELLREYIDIRAKNKIKSFDLVFSL